MKTRSISRKLVSFTLSLLMALPFIVSEEIMNGLRAHAAGFEEGYYFIKHVASGRYVDVTDMSTENGMQLQIYDKYQYHTNQVFKFERVDGTYWKITSLYNGKAVEVRNDGKKSGDPVAQWDYGGIPCQQWKIAQSNEYIQLVNRNSGLALSTSKNKNDNGTKLIQSDTKQAFQLEAVALGGNDAENQRAQNEQDCYNYLKNKGLNTAACAGILASMYVENKFVFGTNALDFYWNGILEGSGFSIVNSTIRKSLITHTANNAAGAASVANVFTEGKHQVYFASLPAFLKDSEKNNAASVAKNNYWGKYDSKERIDRIWTMKAFQQDDSRWGSFEYPKNSGNNIKLAGCGVVSFMNVVYALTGQQVDPTQLAQRSIDDGCITYGNNYKSFFSNNYVNGIVYSGSVNGGDWDALRNRLQNGQVAIMSVPGHYVAISAYNPDNGQFRVLDCAAHYREDCDTYKGGYKGDIRPTSDKGTWMSPSDFTPSNLMTFRAAYLFSVNSEDASNSGNSNWGGYGHNTIIPGIYLLKGSMNIRNGAGTNYSILGVIPSQAEISVTELTNYSWGKTSYNGISGWVNVDPTYATYLRELVKKPNAPSVSLVSAADVALNVISTVSWGAVDGADSYTVTVYNEAGAEVTKQENIKTTSTCFTLNDVGSYTVKAVAVNSKYTSDVATLAQKITVHPNSTVIFLSDPEGTELSKQSVPYNADAVVPETPTKKGFTFIGWVGNYTAVKEDTTVIAKWQRNKYNVNFYNGTGSTLDSQRVYYEDAAVEPQAPAMEGYVFQGWDKKFDYIEDNLDVYPIFAWENADLPVIISDVKAERDSAGYNVTYSLKNAPGQSTECRLVISLKTAEGKLITYTESKSYHLREESVITDTEYVSSQEVASIVEISAVRKFTLVIPIAEKKSSEVTGEAFTNWSTAEPPADALNVEQQKEYRYRTKTIKESKEKLPSPWTLENETIGYTEWGPEQRSDSPVAASDTRNVEVKQEPHHDLVRYRLDYYCTRANDTKKRQYRSYHLTESDIRAMGLDVGYGENSNTKYADWTFFVSPTELDAAVKIGSGEWFDGVNGDYSGTNMDSKPGYTFPNHWDEKARQVIWFVTGEEYNDYTTTYYLYKDRDQFTVYTYSQLSDYSAWSTEKPEESDDKVIEERTVYRYVPADTNMIENTDGELRTISGNVDPSFAGKQAILFVYKIDEAADYTNEAVAQTVIGENGEYAFEFKLREEPTSMNINGEKKPTGDFTVTLGIEGTTSVIYLDPIKAPLPEYTVEYVDHDGTSLLTAKVKDGEAAPIPDAIPERQGYTFVGWNNNPSEIHSNMTMTAVYVKNKYAVAFVDWNSESVVLQQYSYGDPILPPEPKCPEGYDFKGWDILLDGNAIVTENVVACAVFEPKQFEVSFVDYDGKVIDTQTIEYGQTADLPDALEDLEDRSFICWSIGTDTVITQSMIVEPIVLYSETAEAPVISLESNAYDSAQTLEITSADKSKIYYTLDGSDPADNGIEYTGAITISNSCILSCIAKAENKNNSELVTRLYAINSEDAMTDYMAFDLLPEYVQMNAADYNVMSTTGYRYLMKMEVTSKKQYESLVSAGWDTESESWSEWSEWLPSLSGTADLMIEEKSKDAEPIDMQFYQYTHWKYFDEETAKYQYSATQPDGVESVLESIDSPDKLPVSAFIDGASSYTYNGQTWFNQTVITKSVVPNEKVYQYRSKTVVMTKLSNWTETLPDGTEAVEEGEVFCYREPARYILTVVDENGSQLYNDLVFADAQIDLKAMQLDRAGYSLEGIYKSNDQKWDIEKDSVTENLTLTAKYQPIQYTVTFVDEDMVLAEKTVDCFSYAAPPEMYSKEGLVFAGWDSDDYMNVTKDLTIAAKYIPSEDAPSLTLEKSKYYLYPNTHTALSVQTANIDAESETIIWTSMNPDIVSVSDDGVLSAKKAGETNIVITEASTGLVTVCTVSVYNNPQNNPGDVNEDGSVDLKDIVIMSRSLAGNWDSYLNETNADVNKDSSFDQKDVTLLRRYLAGWDVTLA